ncbi:hypothetical protein SAMN03080615_04383 [Amphritea atlantica]|uniref:Uncharacterized protein n=1 Tax=Amphritea atlantica TaxID=355243 RepID=A0A1H9MC95_9GAMM|nr:hypothetical protein [Amphritea atlantica]SER21390.1 hypothetical protein SAMN03080615_04383 [Amphritea atlantica]
MQQDILTLQIEKGVMRIIIGVVLVIFSAPAGFPLNLITLVGLGLCVGKSEILINRSERLVNRRFRVFGLSLFKRSDPFPNVAKIRTYCEQRKKPNDRRAYTVCIVAFISDDDQHYSLYESADPVVIRRLAETAAKFFDVSIYDSLDGTEQLRTPDSVDKKIFAESAPDKMNTQAYREKTYRGYVRSRDLLDVRAREKRVLKLPLHQGWGTVYIYLGQLIFVNLLLGLLFVATWSESFAVVDAIVSLFIILFLLDAISVRLFQPEITISGKQLRYRSSYFLRANKVPVAEIEEAYIDNGNIIIRTDKKTLSIAYAGDNTDDFFARFLRIMPGSKEAEHV